MNYDIEINENHGSGLNELARDLGATHMRLVRSGRMGSEYYALYALPAPMDIIEEKLILKTNADPLILDQPGALSDEEEADLRAAGDLGTR